jgi:hypothetical protein
MSDKNYVGQRVRFTVSFTVDDVLTDPTTVTFKTKDPGRNTDSYTYAGGTVTKSATGVYYRDVELDEEGKWLLYGEGTGACDAVDILEIYANPTGF